MANTKVTSGVIKDDAVGADQLASNAVVTASVVDNAITTAKIADANVLTAKISDSAITNAKMSANSVDSDQYVDGSIDTAHIGNAQVTSAKLASGLTLGGDTTLSGHLDLADDKNIRLGDSDELQIFHTGSGNSIISETGAGSLFLDGTNIFLRKSTASGTALADFLADGAVSLYYAGAAKLATASGGVTVTGTISSGAITSSGVITANDYIDLNNDGNRGKIGYNSNNVFIGSTSSTGSIIFKNNISSGNPPQTGGDTLLTIADGGNATFAGTLASGAITASGSYSSGADGLIAKFQRTGGAVAAAVTYADASTDIEFGTTTNHALSLTTNDTRRLTINNAGASTFTGTVGITSNTPVLSFIESDQSNKQYQIGSYGASFAINDSSASQFRYIVDTNGNHLFNTGGLDCDFRVSSDDITNMLFVDGGNNRVGIGRAAPASIFEVHMATNKNIGFSGGQGELGSIPALVAYADNGALADIGFRGTTLRFATAAAERLRIDSSGKIGINTSSPNSMLEVSFGDNASTQRWSYASSRTNFYLELDTFIPSSGVVAYSFDLKNNGTAYNNNLVLDRGNVGIGTSAPADSLTIQGAGSQVLSIYSTDTGSQSSAKTFLNLYGENTAGVKKLQGQIAAAPGHNASNAGELHFSTNNSSSSLTRRMTIREDGFVGIGTSAPTDPLTIHNGTPSIAFKDTSSNGEFFMSLDGIDLKFFNKSSNGPIIFGTTNAERVRITNTGLLSIANNNNTHNFKANAGSSNSWFGVYDDGNDSANIEIRRSDTAQVFYVLGHTGNYHFAGSDVSDRDLKENIAYIPDGSLELVKQLKPRTYNFKSSEGFVNSSRTGFIAQEVADVMTTDHRVASGTDGDKDMGIDPVGLIAHLTKAIQEQQTLIESLTARIEELEG